jgi:hypothetical protein
VDSTNLHAKKIWTVGSTNLHACMSSRQGVTILHTVLCMNGNSILHALHWIHLLASPTEDSTKMHARMVAVRWFAWMCELIGSNFYATPAIYVSFLYAGSPAPLNACNCSVQLPMKVTTTSHAWKGVNLHAWTAPALHADSPNFHTLHLMRPVVHAKDIYTAPACMQRCSTCSTCLHACSTCLLYPISSVKLFIWAVKFSSNAPTK